MYLTKDSILNADDLPMEELNVPEWGGKVMVRTLTGTERDDFEKESIESREQNDGKVNLSNFRARLVAKAVCDPEGNRLFEDKDVATLGGKSSKALDSVFDLAQKLSGFRKEDIKELTKNSEATSGEGGTSD